MNITGPELGLYMVLLLTALALFDHFFIRKKQSNKNKNKKGRDQ